MAEDEMKRKLEEPSKGDLVLGPRNLSDDFILFNLNLKESLSNALGKKNLHEERAVSKGERQYALTKKLAAEAYLGLKRLASAYKLKSINLKQTKKNKRHEVWSPLLAPLLRTLLMKITRRNDLNEISAQKIWDDCFLLCRQFLDVDSRTKQYVFREMYNPADMEKPLALSDASLSKLEEFRKQGGQRKIDPKAFEKFRFSIPVQSLVSQERTPCPKCSRRVHVYCPFCLHPVIQDPKLPTIDLPIGVDIIRHSRETVKKSTGLHAAIIAPEQVRHFTFPNVPDSDPDTTYILYPTDDAPFIDELDLNQVSRVIIIENTWQGSKKILEHEKLRNIKPVKIRNEVSLYWRHQEVGNDCLATIEAIYYFFVQHWKGAHPEETYEGIFDDLLLLYAHDFHRVFSESTRRPKAWNLSDDPNKSMKVGTAPT